MIAMITLITGVPGAGKTIYALSTILFNELTKNRKICTNIPLDIRQFQAAYGYDISSNIDLNIDGDFSNIATYRETNGIDVKPGILYIIDECQQFYTKEQYDDTEVSALMSLHRKYGLDFVIITQNPSLISRKMRALVEYCHYLSKTRAIGGNGYIVKTYAGQSSRSKPISEREGEYDKDLYKFYQSYSKDGIVEQSTIKAGFKTKLIVFIYKNLLFLVLLIVIFAGGMIFRGFRSVTKPAASPSTPAPAPAPAAPASASLPVSAPAPAPARPPRPPAYPGRIVAEGCVEHDCVALLRLDDGGRISTRDLSMAGFSVFRLSRFTWRIDDAIATAWHQPPPDEKERPSALPQARPGDLIQEAAAK